MTAETTFLDNFLDIARAANSADPLPDLERFVTQNGFRFKSNHGTTEDTEQVFLLTQNGRLEATFITHKNNKRGGWKFELQDFKNQKHILADHNYNVGSSHPISGIKIENLNFAQDRRRILERKYDMAS